jgi:hypothetical protein
MPRQGYVVSCLVDLVRTLIGSAMLYIVQQAFDSPKAHQKCATIAREVPNGRLVAAQLIVSAAV